MICKEECGSIGVCTHTHTYYQAVGFNFSEGKEWSAIVCKRGLQKEAWNVFLAAWEIRWLRSDRYNGRQGGQVMMTRLGNGVKCFWERRWGSRRENSPWAFFCPTQKDSLEGVQSFWSKRQQEMMAVRTGREACSWGRCCSPVSTGVDQSSPKKKISSKHLTAESGLIRNSLLTFPFLSLSCTPPNPQDQ